jgi:hypothetical protein
MPGANRDVSHDMIGAMMTEQDRLLVPFCVRIGDLEVLIEPEISDEYIFARKVRNRSCDNLPVRQIDVKPPDLILSWRRFHLSEKNLQIFTIVVDNLRRLTYLFVTIMPI